MGPSIDGWGECVALTDPTYSAEYVDGAEHVLVHHLLPRLAATARSGIEAADVGRLLAPVHGHPMAKGAIEAAVLDAQLRAADTSFAELLGTATDATGSPAGSRAG